MKKIFLAVLFAAILCGLLLADGITDPNEGSVTGVQYQGYTKTYFTIETDNGTKWDTNAAAMSGTCTFVHAAIDLAADSAFKKFYFNIPAALPSGKYTLRFWGSADATADNADTMISSLWGTWDMPTQKWTFFDPSYKPDKNPDFKVAYAGAKLSLSCASGTYAHLYVAAVHINKAMAWDWTNSVWTATPTWANMVHEMTYNTYLGEYIITLPFGNGNGAAVFGGTVKLKFFTTQAGATEAPLSDGYQFDWDRHNGEITKGSMMRLP
jgi:hypothetical protein